MGAMNVAFVFAGRPGSVARPCTWTIHNGDNECRSRDARKAAKRELINTDGQRYVRRTSSGQFKESDDGGRSLAQSTETIRKSEEALRAAKATLNMFRDKLRRIA